MLTTAALVAAVVIFLLATLPPRPATSLWTGDSSVPRRTIAGAYHVHSNQSDGAGDRAEIASAARRAGLQFVIITDHGDGTTALRPVYIDDVLCMHGVEISTNGGHYVALGMEQAPYPLGGEASAVVEDVARLRGFGIAAHTDSPKPSLAWTDWTVAFDGLEWLNADTEWRNESPVRLSRVLFDYLLRPGPALASALDRPSGTLARWDAGTSRRPIVALAGQDAHGGGGTPQEGRRWNFTGIPSYEASFRSFATRVVLDAPLTGNAAADANAVLAAIRSGRTFTAIDALAAPGFVDFNARQGDVTGAMGSTLRPGPADLHITTSTVPGAEVVLFRGGVEWQRVTGDTARIPSDSFDGSVRVEVQIPGAPGVPPVPWIVTNPIYFLPPASPAPAPRPRTFAPADLSWHVEKDRGSDGDIAGPENDIMVDFRLRGEPRVSQFVALAGAFRGARPQGRAVAFDAHASRPMRLSVQLRYPSGGGQRWGSSVYVDTTSRRLTVALEDMVPMDHQTGAMPPLDQVDSILFVVDLVNAVPGASGTFRITNVAVASSQ